MKERCAEAAAGETKCEPSFALNPVLLFCSCRRFVLFLKLSHCFAQNFSQSASEAQVFFEPTTFTLLN